MGDGYKAENQAQVMQLNCCAHHNDLWSDACKTYSDNGRSMEGEEEVHVE